MENKSDKKLFSSFPSPSLADWIKVASGEIGGENPMEKLTWQTGGLSIRPIYTSMDVAESERPPFYLGSDFQARAWSNMPEVVVGNEKEANDVAMEHLSNEADGVLFRVKTPDPDIPTLLKGISLEHCTVSFFAEAKGAAKTIMNYIAGSASPERITGAIFSQSPEKVSLSGGKFRSFGISIPQNEATEELMEALVKGVEVIEDLVKGEDGSLSGFGRIAFQLSLGSGLMTDVAKMKALRLLWGQVAAAYGIVDYDTNDLYIHGYANRWTEARLQPHGNMLNGTVAAIAGIAGGCNAITVSAEDPENKMMRRIARNVSHILLEESHLGKVNDPFAGAYAVEMMVNEMAKIAWGKFQARI